LNEIPAADTFAVAGLTNPGGWPRIGRSKSIFSFTQQSHRRKPGPRQLAGDLLMLRFPRIVHLAVFTVLAASAQETQEGPKSYDCYRANKPIRIDGKLDDRAWQAAPWTTDFVDIEGSAKPMPRFRTRAKILWDDDYLYIGAELEEPEVKATLTKHDSVIFHDNDFEVFLKPPGEAPGYFEFEINALNTGWDLYLNKPYREGGKADNSWDIPGLKTAIAIQGTLNDASDKDRGWTVEMAFPWSAFASRLPVTRPQIGSEWRVNFSRVEWKAGQPKEDNWVWSPQGLINMHVPERWGYLHFRGKR
jgi:hypothetical protein